MKYRGSMKVNSSGHLEIGGCDTVELVKEYGSPLVVLDEALIRNLCREYHRNFIDKYEKMEVSYASKAFLTPALCKIIESEGLGLDVVSGGELYTALKADFPVNKIYLHGNNKSRYELKLALEVGIARIVVDNLDELNSLNEVAASLNTKANVILRITPGIEAHTHEYISTGQIDSKFGFTLPNGQALEAIELAIEKSNINLKGLHCHIGSQIFDMESYGHAAKIMLELMGEVKTKYDYEIEELDLGGGFGIYYTEEDSPNSIENYADIVLNTVKEEAKKQNLKLPKIIIEPGRSIIGPTGTNLYTIGTTKDIPDVRKYVAVDGGMSDNIRPALYGAKYEGLIANKALEEPTEVVTITGKCCESGDMLIHDLKIPKAEAGDILAVFSTGAYGYSMASNYNFLGRPAVVLVNEGQADLIIRRETPDDILKNHIIPTRL